MATITLTLELPEEILINFNGLNEIRRALYEDFIIIQRQQGHISLGKAARITWHQLQRFF
jgi:predicted HTH domain antitoxin